MNKNQNFILFIHLLLLKLFFRVLVTIDLHRSLLKVRYHELFDLRNSHKMSCKKKQLPLITVWPPPLISVSLGSKKQQEKGKHTSGIKEKEWVKVFLCFYFLRKSVRDSSCSSVLSSKPWGRPKMETIFPNQLKMTIKT